MQQDHFTAGTKVESEVPPLKKYIPKRFQSSLASSLIKVFVCFSTCSITTTEEAYKVCHNVQVLITTKLQHIDTNTSNSSPWEKKPHHLKVTAMPCIEVMSASHRQPRC